MRIELIRTPVQLVRAREKRQTFANGVVLQPRRLGRQPIPQRRRLCEEIGDVGLAGGSGRHRVDGAGEEVVGVFARGEEGG